MKIQCFLIYFVFFYSFFVTRMGVFHISRCVKLFAVYDVPLFQEILHHFSSIL